MKILVPGGFGFIGAQVTQRLRREGHEVYAYDRNSNLYRVRQSTNELVEQSITIARVIAEHAFDAVVYLASKLLPSTDITRDNMEEFLREDFSLTLKALYAAREAGVRKFIFTSSGGSIYDDGAASGPFRESAPLRAINFYGVNKICVEQHMRVLHGGDFSAISLRVSNPYYHVQRKSKGQGIIPIFIRNAIEGNGIQIYGDGLNIRDYVHLDDVADAFAAAIDYQGTQDTFNIGTGVGTSIVDIIELVKKVSGRSLDVEYRPQRKTDKRYAVLDCSLAASELSWRARMPLEQGIALCYSEILDEYRG